MEKQQTTKNKLLYIGYFLFFILLCSLTIRKLGEVPFHGDESSWISSSDSFEAFIRMDFNNPVWQESYWTLTQPPVPRYFIGIGRTLGNYEINDLNNPYDFFLTEEENISQNAIPSEGLLWWSRLPMAILMAASIFLIFLGASRLYVHSISVLAIGIFLLNPFPFYVLRLALGESALLFFSLLVIVFGYRLMQVERKNSGKFWLWLILMSISCGLATASKLNGGATVLGAFMVVFLFLRKNRAGKTKPIFQLLILFAVGAIAFGTFVLVNPYLYAAPLKNALSMLMFRSYEIGLQTTLYPEYHISGLWQHVQANTLNIFQSHATLHFNGAWGINLVLFTFGVYAMIKKRSDEQIALLIPFIFIAAALTLPALCTPLAYPRYFLFPVIFTQLIIAVGVAFLFLNIGKKIKIKLFPVKSNPA